MVSAQHRRLCLLRDVGEFVRQEPASLQCRRRKLSRTEHDVVSHCVGVCAHVARRLLGAGPE